MYRYRSESNKTMANAKLTCDRNYPHPFLQMHAPPCDPMKKPCLFNVQWDPCEFHNLASFMPNTLKVLRDRLNFYHRIVKMPVYPSFDDKADPENNGGVWGPWKDATNRLRQEMLLPKGTPLHQINLSPVETQQWETRLSQETALHPRTHHLYLYKTTHQ